MSATVPRGQAGQLVATAQYMVFEPGLYAVDVGGAAPTVTDMGIVLPCIRLESAPPTPVRPGRAAVIDPSERGWLWPREESTFVMVLGGRAGAVMTIYRANDGTPAPEIRIREVKTNVGPSASREAVAAAQAQIAALAAARAPAMGAAPAVAVEPAATDAAVTVQVMAHVTRVGDVTVPDAEGWVGRKGGNLPVEGFRIIPSGALGPADIEYQGILGNNWSTPWFAGGEFCGSRGMMLPLLGLCIRLKGAAAESFQCAYRGVFIGGAARGPCLDGEACQVGDAPLEAFAVEIRRREASADVAPEPEDAPEPEAPTPAPPRRRRVVVE